jgi:protein-disulfide isomerase
MIEDRIPDEPAQTPSKPGWKTWFAAGGCLILLCSLLMVGAMMLTGVDFTQQFIPSRIESAGQLPRASTLNNTMGNPNAPVHIIAYSDFQCPYCLKFWRETEPRLIEEYVNTGKVYFEYRSLGAFLGEESAWAAEGAYCAGDQGKFWEYHDALFANWNGENTGNYARDRLVRFAESLELNVQAFESCLREERHKRTVEQDAADAAALGIRATPTFLINGFMLEGAQSFSIFREYIEDALRQKPSL